MTRLFTDGAEMEDLLLFSAAYGNIAVDNAAPAPFASDYYYKTSYSFGSDGGLLPFVGLTECYVRARILITSAVGGVCTIFPIFRSSSGTEQASLCVTAANTFAAYRGNSGGTLLQDSGVAMLANQWYLVEVYYKMDDAPNGRFVVKVDGNQIIDFTGDTEAAAAASFNTIMFNAMAGDIGSLCIDDFAMNDTNGAVDNSWCGDGIVVAVYPDGNGTHNNWHGSDGNDVDNYLLCDEFPNDGDTTYVYHDNTSGTQQQFAMSHVSFTGYTILRLYAEARARKTSAAAMTLKLGQLASGGADVVSAGRALYTPYTRLVGDDSFVNPVDGNPWEEADIDAIEFVAEVA